MPDRCPALRPPLAPVPGSSCRSGNGRLPTTCTRHTPQPPPRQPTGIPLPAKLLHGLENVSFCRTGEFLPTVFNGNYKFYCCRAHREYVCIYDLTIIQNFLNRALRRAGLALSAAVKKFSMKMCSSNSRPRIRLVMLLSIMGGGPHRYALCPSNRFPKCSSASSCTKQRGPSQSSESACSDNAVR